MIGRIARQMKMYVCGDMVRSLWNGYDAKKLWLQFRPFAISVSSQFRIELQTICAPNQLTHGVALHKTLDSNGSCFQLMQLTCENAVPYNKHY